MSTTRMMEKRIMTDKLTPASVPAPTVPDKVGTEGLAPAPLSSSPKPRHSSPRQEIALSPDNP